MRDIKAAETLWASSMLPEGILEKWLVADGAVVATGDPVVEIRIEQGLHMILATASGRLTALAAEDDIIEPGAVLATVDTVEP